MKAITLHQPWASLIAARVKTIETRGRRTSYRGRVAIHAGLHRPPLMHLPPLSRRRDDPADRQTWLVIDTITDPAFQGPRPEGSRVPKRAKTPTLFYPHEGPHGRPWDETAGTSSIEQGSAVLLPLGAVVASAVLTDCVPILAAEDSLPVAWMPHVAPSQGTGDLLRWLGPTETELLSTGRLGWRTQNIEDQRPLGDFRPGRWALLLDDIAPTAARCPACWGEDGVICFRCMGLRRCDPVPARGQQAVPWEWTP